jgi:transcriptional regulator with XRE-family HTH domain
VRAQDSPQQRVLWEAKHARTGPRRRAQQKFDKLATVPPRNRLFAEKLQDAMTKAGLSKSEIARRIWGTTKDKRGFTVAKNRDRMGQYTSGATYPEPETLQKLADAVGVPVEELTSNPGPTPGDHPAGQSRRTPSASTGELILTELPAQPTKTRLQIDRVVHWKVAEQIRRILKEAEISGHPGEDTEVNPQVGTIVGGTDTKNQATK